MRILLDCRMATWTGVGRYTVGLAGALGARDDVELSVVMAGDEESPVAHELLGNVFSARAHPFSLGGALELSRIARWFKPDVTHCLHFLTPFPAPHPLVVTLHDLSPLLVPGLMPSAAKRAFYRAWNARAVRVADRIVVDASFTVGEIERVFPRAAGRITSIPIAADDFSAGEREPLPRPLAALASTPYLLSMGSTRSHKDLPTLLAAFARIAPSRPDLRLLLVGADVPGFVDANLPAETSAAIRERVAFTGHVTDGQLRSLYAGAAVFAFPSRYEGFGLPPLEAMALGAPVVVANAASLPEVVGDAALLVPPGDPGALAVAVERVLSDTDLRERLVAAGRARAAEFTWAATAEATARVYREVVSGASAAPDATLAKTGTRP